MRALPALRVRPLQRLNQELTELASAWCRELQSFLVPTGGFPGGSDGAGSACDAGDLGLIPEWGRSPGEGNDYPLQCSCLETPTDRGVQTVGHGCAANTWTFTLGPVKPRSSICFFKIRNHDCWQSGWLGSPGETSCSSRGSQLSRPGRWRHSYMVMFQ